MTFWGAVLIAYFLGCIPFGLIVARVNNVDLRSQGSGNIGATNAMRVMGKKAGAITLVGDMLKGTAGVLIAVKLAGGEAGYYAAAAAVLGHDFPVFSGFKGGKGVATSFGVLLALCPYVAITGFAVWLLSLSVWKMSSLSALVSFAAIPAAAYLMRPDDKSLIIICVFLTVTIFAKHHSNIRRIIDGDESQIGRKKGVTP